MEEDPELTEQSVSPFRVSFDLFDERYRRYLETVAEKHPSIAFFAKSDEIRFRRRGR